MCNWYRAKGLTGNPLAKEEERKGLQVDEVNVEDTVEMLPKSRRALTIQEIAALARSSLHGISQVVKDHVTKPTAMAQGRVAHLIEWKGWCKPTDSPAALESDFNSYSDLSEGEQEARFAAGVAEQFAIAEAKLRAWSSVDGDDSNDDSYDEDFPPANEPPHTTQSTDTMVYPHYLRDLLHSHVCQRLVTRAPCEGDSSAEPSPAGGSPDTLCSSLCSLEDHPLLRDLGCPPATPADLAAKILGALQGGRSSWPGCRGGGDCAFRSLGRGRPRRRLLLLHLLLRVLPVPGRGRRPALQGLRERLPGRPARVRRPQEGLRRGILRGGVPG
ncbi:hypothetical protein ANANG_G00234670 [Anguilla anguilla]|uniref:Family with sequence similarity 131 member A n=1 Tax=Anguilla anguilla TaxID=7936 RepID=A0A9D3LVH9_ANGAN|nr:hypothetical protein ANANG_G00234670 [Anguilla anguilla]